MQIMAKPEKPRMRYTRHSPFPWACWDDDDMAFAWTMDAAWQKFQYLKRLRRVHPELLAQRFGGRR